MGWFDNDKKVYDASAGIGQKRGNPIEKAERNARKIDAAKKAELQRQAQARAQAAKNRWW